MNTFWLTERFEILSNSVPEGDTAKSNPWIERTFVFSISNPAIKARSLARKNYAHSRISCARRGNHKIYLGCESSFILSVDFPHKKRLRKYLIKFVFANYLVLAKRKPNPVNKFISLMAGAFRNDRMCIWSHILHRIISVLCGCHRLSPGDGSGATISTPAVPD